LGGRGRGGGRERKRERERERGASLSRWENEMTFSERVPPLIKILPKTEG